MAMVMSTPTAATVSFTGEAQTSGTLLVKGGGVDIEFNELELPRNKSAIGVPLITPSPGNPVLLIPAVGELGDEKELLPMAGVLSNWVAGTAGGGSLQLARLLLRPPVIVLPVPLHRFDELLVPDQRLFTVTVPFDVIRT